MKHELFISYSRVDSAFAIRLVRDLKQHGLEAWLDQLDIPTGVNWDNEIEKALDHSDTMVLILSESSAKSENVKNEISAAIERNKHIVPIVLSKGAVPLIINRLQREDFTGDYDAALKKLLRRLSGGNRTSSLKAITEDDVARMAKEAAARLGMPANAPVPPDSLSPATVRKSEPFVPPKHARRTIFAAIGGAVIAAGLVLTFTLTRTPSPEGDRPQPAAQLGAPVAPPFNNSPPPDTATATAGPAAPIAPALGQVAPAAAPAANIAAADPTTANAPSRQLRKRRMNAAAEAAAPAGEVQDIPITSVPAEDRPITSVPAEDRPITSLPPEAIPAATRPMAIVCREPNYGGMCRKMPTTLNLIGTMIDNDTISSISLGTCTSIIVCGDIRLGGTCEQFRSDQADLGATPIGDDNVSSFECVRENTP